MTKHSPSIRKAAVLVASLDAATADLLLGQMSAEQADAVRRLVLDLDEIDADEQRRVIDEFYRIGPLLPEQNPPGVDLEDYLSRRIELPIDEFISNSESTPNDFERRHRPASVLPNVEVNSTPFSFLQETSPESLVPMLEREHPQAITLVLAHLPPERAGHVLARLPASLQADVVRRLVDLEEADPHVIREVERAVETWLRKRQPVRRRVAGEAAVSAILKSAGTSARRQILNNLSAHNRTLAHRFADPQPAPRRLPFKELAKLPALALAAIVHMANRRTALVALTGMEEEAVDELLNHCGDEEADEISAALAQVGPVRLSDIDRAQDELMQLAGLLYAEGRLPGIDEVHLTAVA